MSQLKQNMQMLGKNYSKEMMWYAIISILILCIDIPIYFIRGVNFLLAIPLFLLIFFSYIYFSRYSSAVKKIYEDRMEEFIRLFTYLGIYINDGFNVFRALESIQSFSSESFLPLLKKLVQEIEEDKTVTPFVNFSLNFQDISVKEVMISIYQMVDEGQGGAYITQFQHLFGKLSDEKHAALKQKRIDGLSKLSLLPLIGSGITMFMITFSLVEIMGGVINVL